MVVVDINILVRQNLTVEARDTVAHTQIIGVDQPAAVGHLVAPLVLLGIVLPELLQTSHKLAHIRRGQGEATRLVLVGVLGVAGEIQLELLHITRFQDVRAYTAVEFGLQVSDSLVIGSLVIGVLRLDLGLIGVVLLQSFRISGLGLSLSGIVGVQSALVLLHLGQVCLVLGRIHTVLLLELLLGGFVLSQLGLVLGELVGVACQSLFVGLVGVGRLVDLVLGSGLLQDRRSIVGAVRPFDGNTTTVVQHRVGVAKISVHMAISFPLGPVVHDPVHHGLVIHIRRRLFDEGVILRQPSLLSDDSRIVEVLVGLALRIPCHVSHDVLIGNVQVLV